MPKEEQFVNELIGYIFAYPDDDYMTMECLCRKLHKYGLIEKKDGEWTTDFIDHKTELTHNQHVQHIGSVETMSCQECKHWKYASNYGWDCEFESVEDCKYEPKDAPQTERSE